MNQHISFYPICSIQRSEPFLYVLEIAKTKIMFSQGFPLSNLNYFTFQQNTQKKVCIPTETNQYCINHQNKIYMNNTIRFDLQFLKYIDYSDIGIFLVCNQKDVLLLNYLLKIKSFKPQIICTTASYSLSQHFIAEFHELAEKRNRRFYDTIKEDYFKEQEAYQLFEDCYHNNFQEFTEIFPPQSAIPSLQLVNYHQIVKIPLLQVAESLEIEAIPNGVEIGGASFIIRLGSYFKLIFAQQLCLTSQICRPIQMSIYDNADYLILGYEQPQCVNYVHFILETLSSGLNVVVPFMDYNTILNFQEDLSEKIQHKCHKIFIISLEFYRYLQIANSLVEFLHPSLQSNIMLEPPLNPFSKLFSLIKGDKVIVIPKVEDLKFEGHTLSSTVKAVTPSLFFIFDSSFKLGQQSLLFDYLDSTNQNQNTIYSVIQQEQSFNFGLLLIEPQDQKLLEQMQSQYKMKVFIPNQNLSNLEYTLSQLKNVNQILLPDQVNLRNARQYKMLQKIDLKIPQIHLLLEIQEKGNSSKTLCNIELSKVKCKIQQNNKNYIAAIDKQPYSVTYMIGNQNANQILEQIHQEILDKIPNVMRINDDQNSNYWMYNNTLTNQTQLIVQMQENTAKVYAISIQILNTVYDIIFRNMRLKTF